MLRLSAIWQALTGPRRSPRWRSVRDKFLAAYPNCAACGRKAHTAHHIKPVHLFPALELAWDNLVSTCNECHLYLFHSGDFRAWNPHCCQDAALMLRRRRERRYA